MFIQWCWCLPFITHKQLHPKHHQHGHLYQHLQHHILHTYHLLQLVQPIYQVSVINKTCYYHNSVSCRKTMCCYCYYLDMSVVPKAVAAVISVVLVVAIIIIIIVVLFVIIRWDIINLQLSCKIIASCFSEKGKIRAHLLYTIWKKDQK